jgi:hypothetical protein
VHRGANLVIVGQVSLTRSTARARGFEATLVAAGGVYLAPGAALAA